FDLPDRWRNEKGERSLLRLFRLSSYRSTRNKTHPIRNKTQPALTLDLLLRESFRHLPERIELARLPKLDSTGIRFAIRLTGGLR
ncbi:MAG: hypothetical protein ACRD6N_09685, partial [Pyrinomonadaceae bacterium]